MACDKTIPSGHKARIDLKNNFLRALDLICEKPLLLIPGAREHGEVFSFIEFDGPPTNNHAERALRPLVIFRKVCMGTRSREGSENMSVFTSLTQTAKLQGHSIIDLFLALLSGTTAQAQDVIFNNSS